MEVVVNGQFCKETEKGGWADKEIKLQHSQGTTRIKWGRLLPLLLIPLKGQNLSVCSDMKSHSASMWWKEPQMERKSQGLGREAHRRISLGVLRAVGLRFSCLGAYETLPASAVIHRIAITCSFRSHSHFWIGKLTVSRAEATLMTKWMIRVKKTKLPFCVLRGGGGGRPVFLSSRALCNCRLSEFLLFSYCTV